MSTSHSYLRIKRATVFLFAPFLLLLLLLSSDHNNHQALPIPVQTELVHVGHQVTAQMSFEKACVDHAQLSSFPIPVSIDLAVYHNLIALLVDDQIKFPDEKSHTLRHMNVCSGSKTGELPPTS